ncbi:26S proteasome non-ATPase regulatory subunit 9-like [Cucurbita pepo subsp. pepo]|uniref:26S proteasome non-ATPase regulatory subunit 9-like n=1 Tax=Cucurbita pepo subsp. pepo TaxID=3664 RepID=UPI000C9D2FA0|nr:26S proteasome non-ATPase regulatory subunit 9-like [Cucurbita pepo subsp. pepo]
MVASNLKSETMDLMQKRSAIEAQMDAIISRLCQPGGPGLSGNLVDSEGFPRSDIDIPVIRSERRQLTELRNDHTEITEKINQNIQVLHSAKPASSLSLSKDAGNTEVSNGQRSSVTTVALPSSNVSSTAMDIDANGGIPFALVDEIADASPAADDGLQLGDQVLKFGNVEGGDDLLHRLASEAQSNQGRPIPVVVTRHGTPVNLTVTPRSWHGRGLLGCHFRML